MRVLLVEDEAPLRETLAARLKRDGFAVDAAGDGEEGLYLGREVPFDVAIIDLGLPKLSGMDLVKQLREAGQRCPILILTARSSWQDKVLEYLMLHAGELVSKADLTEHIYQQDFDRDSNVLEVFIGRLRRKLDPDNAIKPIETVRGRGYRFALERTNTGSDTPEPMQQPTENNSTSST